MHYLRSFIIGGYAYYRNKKFEHGKAVTMLMLPVIGLPTLILIGIGLYLFQELSFYIDNYALELILVFLIASTLGTYKMERFLDVYKGEEVLTRLSKEIRIHSVIVYTLIAVNFCIWYFLR
ncbi:hypothetical protein G3R49_04710 [Shewanella sp. WXL01]|uniref:hypothetical protein n=1 Tax=Shewanella sp. WXL01 TaxID=2709721 RepID=UPI0014386761|nr:hypothetical protein [Shewanella sp. WXL01]NKF49871.1 hypothetical protein [Shewanella sp. WXL01]